jgi:hypothetical protein
MPAIATTAIDLSIVLSLPYRLRYLPDNGPVKGFWRGF